MDAYESFAKVYDVFMDNVPYEEWKNYIVKVLRSYEVENGLILDLGCGTGTMTRMLSEEGYDMIGVDGSEEMLMEARDYEYDSDVSWNEEEIGNDEQFSNENCDDSDASNDIETAESSPILYLCQDMTSFELYGTVRAIVSVCDCMNYLLKEEDLLQCFKLANNYLDPSGLFLFDMNTISKYESMGDSTICENREEGSFIWENTYDTKTQINEYDVTFYTESEDVPGLYERTEETHLQRGYTIEKVKELLEKAGLKFIGVYDGYSDMPASDGSERLLFLAQECSKTPEV